jgi:hypothetical protein
MLIKRLHEPLRSLVDAFIASAQRGLCTEFCVEAQRLKPADYPCIRSVASQSVVCGPPRRRFKAVSVALGHM